MGRLISRLRYLIQKGLSFVLILFLLAFVFLHTQAGKHNIRIYLEKQLTHLTSMPVSIEKFDFESLHLFHMDGVKVLLPSGAFVEAQSLRLQGSLLALLSAGELSCTALDIKYPGLPTMELQLSAHVLGSSLSLQGTLCEASNRASLAKCDADLILRTYLGIPLALDFTAPLHAEMAMSLPLAAFVNPFVSETVFIAGQLEASVAASGTLMHPIFAGKGKLANGHWESLDSGALFPAIEAEFQITSSLLEVAALTARDPFSGSITGHGSMQLCSDLPFQLYLNLHNTALLHSDVAEGIFSGSLLCTGNRTHIDLKGEMQSEKLEIFLPEHHPREIGAVDVVYINQTDIEPPPTRTRRKSKESILFYDLHIRNPKSISIHGNGLTSHWKGNVIISGPSNAPMLDGEWRIASGDYLFNGKKWALTQGTIALKGEGGKKSSLYTVAELEIDAIPIEVIVKGALDDLSLVFRSSPQMTQKEILCHILFGRGLREITPFQGAELTKSINKLANSSSQGIDILDKIRNSFGFIDRVDFVHGSGDQAGDLSLKVGSYLFPRLFVGVKKNFTSHANGIEIEADLTRNVKLQAEFGDDREKHIHLKWKRDY